MEPPVALAGMLDTSPRDVESRIAETDLDAGYGVVRGTDVTIRQAKLPANTGDVTNGFLGVVQYSLYREPTGMANRYLAKDVIPVVAQGGVWVLVDGTAGAILTADGPVYCVHSGAHAGKFRSDAGAGGTAATLVSGAKAKTSAVAGGIARIKINVP